jgi:hypothetical protein
MFKQLFAGAALCGLLTGGTALAAPVKPDQHGDARDYQADTVTDAFERDSSWGGEVSSTIAATPAVTAFPAGSSSSWFKQIGLTAAVESQAKMGAGVTIGVVDTGVVASNLEITGRVSSLSGCAAVTFACPKGFNDDNGHGTATASIAAGRYGSGGKMSGVAPAATILAEKVLDASGSGYDTDIANGIVRAANGGAQVINLSLTYAPTAAVINAINAATAKGAVIVWAGGNSGAVFDTANTTGLSAAALSHLVFVGSVNSANGISYFSNKPGTGAAVAGSARASYASLWLMAPGENIVAPEVAWGGANNYVSWSGTSMSTPEVSGAIALLEATWPVLAKNGTATSVLFASATDLGVRGADATYGNGLLNLTKAFQPVGTLSVVTAAGKTTAVGGVTTMTSGALGNLPGVLSIMSHYTSFDAFQRNFTVNLSNLVKPQASLANVLAGQAAAPVAATSVALAGGGYLTVAASDTSFYDAADAQALSLAQRTSGPRDAGAFYLSMTGADGTSVSVGRGLPSTAAFASAVWGEASVLSFQANELGVSNALMSYAQGGDFASVGANLGARARLGMTWTTTPERPLWQIASSPIAAQASAAAVGLSVKANSRWTLGVTAASLREGDSLLGSTYDPNGLLSLGSSHRSSSIGLSSAFDLGHGRALMLDGALARIDGATMTGGVIASVSPMTARAYGVSFIQSDTFQDGDHLTLSVRKPLKVISGSAELAVTNVDSQGEPTTTLVRTSLRPSGDETDLSLGYGAQLKGGLNLTAGLAYREDAYNIRGLGDANARLSLSLRL